MVGVGSVLVRLPGRGRKGHDDAAGLKLERPPGGGQSAPPHLETTNAAWPPRVWRGGGVAGQPRVRDPFQACHGAAATWPAPMSTRERLALSPSHPVAGLPWVPGGDVFICRCRGPRTEKWPKSILQLFCLVWFHCRSRTVFHPMSAGGALLCHLAAQQAQSTGLSGRQRPRLGGREAPQRRHWGLPQLRGPL